MKTLTDKIKEYDELTRWLDELYVGSHTRKEGKPYEFTLRERVEQLLVDHEITEEDLR